MVRVTIKNNLLSAPLLTADNSVRKSCRTALALLPLDANDEPATSNGRKAELLARAMARRNSACNNALACGECFSNSGRHSNEACGFGGVEIRTADCK